MWVCRVKKLYIRRRQFPIAHDIDIAGVDPAYRPTNNRVHPVFGCDKSVYPLLKKSMRIDISFLTLNLDNRCIMKR